MEPNRPATVPPAWRVDSRREVSLADGRSVMLRPVAVDDADLLAEFFAQLTEREIYYFFHLDETAARRLALDVERDPAYRLVAIGYLDDRAVVLGYAFLQWNVERPPTFGICLRPGTQSRGLGGLLIDHLLASAAASGVDRVQLTVHPDNTRALRLYQRHGFRLVDEFVNRHQGVKQYRMEAELGRPRPRVLDEAVIVAVGGVGVGLAAARVQTALAQALGGVPLLIGQSTSARRVFLVAELGTPPARWGEDAARVGHGAVSTGWIVSLDAAHLLIGGTDPAVVARAADRYVELLVANGANAAVRNSDDIPFHGLHLSLPGDR